MQLQYRLDLESGLERGRMLEIICKKCLAPYPHVGAPYRCGNCGGFYDFAGVLHFDPAQIHSELTGIWRYKESFNLFSGSPVVSLGEGRTPLIWDVVNGKKVGMKMESLNPTGSYKDRGSAVLVSQLVARGICEALEDSSGNAGASFAAYCARGGIKAKIFVPEAASGPKRSQIELYGADLVSVPGPRSAAAAAVLDAVGPGKVATLTCPLGWRESRQLPTSCGRIWVQHLERLLRR
jgi:threonine synthase